MRFGLKQINHNILLDLVIITTEVVKWAGFIFIFATDNTAKLFGSYLGYKLAK